MIALLIPLATSAGFVGGILFKMLCDHRAKARRDAAIDDTIWERR
jgi:hypothetical protein